MFCVCREIHTRQCCCTVCTTFCCYCAKWHVCFVGKKSDFSSSSHTINKHKRNAAKNALIFKSHWKNTLQRQQGRHEYMWATAKAVARCHTLHYSRNLWKIKLGVLVPISFSSSAVFQFPPFVDENNIIPKRRREVITDRVVSTWAIHIAISVKLYSELVVFFTRRAPLQIHVSENPPPSGRTQVTWQKRQYDVISTYTRLAQLQHLASSVSSVYRCINV